jgi:hypothetical protein
MTIDFDSIYQEMTDIQVKLDAAEEEITKLRAERDAARQAIHIFLPPGNEAMEDIIWENQPDNALMTIRIRYGEFKRARALLATERKDAT